eukprot:TRINITY_DN2509_c0_g3_i1.p1 TRINITY_DN2509_c0_g3~~TRINITY_DN2509_c0_g3_i1.p1  ORF type:complete len:347 (-),score=54.73 TRINITY_DN2509_c0_g3_i1:93-1133(-)
MHRHSQTTITDCKPPPSTAESTRISKALVDKMVQKYFTYLAQMPTRNKLKTSNQEEFVGERFLFPEISEGSVHAPLPSHVKMEHYTVQKHSAASKIKTLKPLSMVSKPGKPLPRKTDTKQLKATAPSKQKGDQRVYNSTQAEAPTEIATDDIVKEMLMHGLDKANTRIGSKKTSLESVHRNVELNCAPDSSDSNSTQSTNNSHAESSIAATERLFTSPIQDCHNGNYSPKECSHISNLKPEPLANTKTFLPPYPPNRTKEGLQVLKAITKNQQKAGEKQWIIDDLGEEQYVVSAKPVAREKAETAKETPKMETKQGGRARHRRVTSQIIDKQTLQALRANKGLIEV